MVSRATTVQSRDNAGVVVPGGVAWRPTSSFLDDSRAAGRGEARH